MIRILVFNYGSTSAKLSIYEDKICVHEKSFTYSEEEQKFEWAPKEDVAVKVKAVLDWFDEIGLTMDDIDAFAPRLGATYYGRDGGTFKIEGEVRKAIEAKYHPDTRIVHPLFETIEILRRLQEMTDKEIPIYATDPASVDQMLPEAKLTGIPGYTRRSSAHVLNQKAAARRAAEALGKRYDECNLIVVHLGGGSSIGAHMHGKLVDSTDGTGDADGPFTSLRAGAAPASAVIDLCFSGKFDSAAEVTKYIKTQCGLQGYLGTSDLRDVIKSIKKGDERAKLVFDGMCYKIAQCIGSLYATMFCDVDAIVFTGGMAHAIDLVNEVSKRVGKMAPVLVYPGEMENEALAFGAYRVMTGEEEPAVYYPEREILNPYFGK